MNNCITDVNTPSTSIHKLGSLDCKARQLIVILDLVDYRLMSEPTAVAEVDLDALRVHGQVEGLDLEENILGKGAYCVVYEVFVDGKKCAAKKLHDVLIQADADNSMIRRFRQECCVLSQMKHPNVVGFVGIHYGHNRDDISLIMERLHCDLADFVKRNPSTPLYDRLHILYDVSKGLDYLHSLNPPLIHRDLAAHNALLTEDLTAKIGDFGSSRYVDPGGHERLSPNPGILAYMPPECLVANPTYTTKLDIFSFGVLILHTVTGEVPTVHSRRDTDVQKKMGESHCLYPLTVHCLCDNPDQRPTTDEVRNGVYRLCTKHPRPVSYFS